MAATTMVLKSSLLEKLKTDFPEVNLSESNAFRWSPSERTIFYTQPMTTQDDKFLLHELAHALLNHSDFEKDIELIHREREAWEYAADNLANRYGVGIKDSDIEEAIDSYRDWLHERSRCPDCSSISPQTPKNTYRCLVCGCSWRANDARDCQLRRYRTKD